MASTLQTDYSEKKTQSEQDYKKLRIMQSVENDKKLFGWRYVQIDARPRVLVPCDKEGNPTEDGKRKIEAFKKL